MSKIKPYLSVVVPAYNEESRIRSSLRRIIKCLDSKGYKYEIIIVDDGSQDRTLEIVQTIAREKSNITILRNEDNRGKGFSVRKGVLHSKGDFILFSDADLSTPIEEVDKLLEWLRKGYDIALGSRALPGSDVRVHQPWYRETMGKIFNLLVQLLVIEGIWDTQCGFKCFTEESARAIFSKGKINRFSFDVEAIFIAKKSGYKIKEVPVVWVNSPISKVHIFKDSLRMFIDLLKIRVWDLKGDYR